MHDEQIATSDDAAIEGATYQLVLKRDGEPDESLDLSSATYAEFLRAWKRLENEEGKRLDLSSAFERFIERAHRTICNAPQRRV